MKPKAQSIFTQNESEIIPGLIEGKKVKAIARDLNRSAESINKAIDRMKAKTQTLTTAHLIAYLFKNNLIAA